MDRRAIDYTWLLTWEECNPGGWAYTELSVEKVLECKAKYPCRFIPMYAPDPHVPTAPETLLSHAKEEVRGCGELKATLRWSSPEVRALLDAAQSGRMPVIFHMEQSYSFLLPHDTDSRADMVLIRLIRTRRFRGIPGTVYRYLVTHSDRLKRWQDSRTYFMPGYMLDVAELEAALAGYPTLTFIGHGPLFWKHISRDYEKGGAFPDGPIENEGELGRLLRTYPNLYADISGLSGFNALKRDPVFSRRFVAEFSHKLLYGTDNFLLGQEELLRSLTPSRCAFQSIMGGLACKLAPPDR